MQDSQAPQERTVLLGPVACILEPDSEAELLMEQLCTDVACASLLNVKIKEDNLWEMAFLSRQCTGVENVRLHLIGACPRKRGRSVSLAKPACQI